MKPRVEGVEVTAAADKTNFLILLDNFDYRLRYKCYKHGKLEMET